MTPQVESADAISCRRWACPLLSFAHDAVGRFVLVHERTIARRKCVVVPMPDLAQRWSSNRLVHLLARSDPRNFASAWYENRCANTLTTICTLHPALGGAFRSPIDRLPLISNFASQSIRMRSSHLTRSSYGKTRLNPGIDATLQVHRILHTGRLR